MAADEVMCVFLRVSPESRASSINLTPVEDFFALPEPMALTPDHKDSSVYFFEMPQEIDEKTARRLMNDLADQASVDEVWHDTVSIAGRLPEPTALTTPKPEFL